MANSRYTNNVIYGEKGTPNHYGTYDLPQDIRGWADVDLVGSNETIRHIWASSDRLDKLASRYYGDDEYWWVIAMVNKITYPLGIKPGTELLIPVDVIPVLQKLELA